MPRFEPGFKIEFSIPSIATGEIVKLFREGKSDGVGDMYVVRRSSDGAEFVVRDDANAPPAIRIIPYVVMPYILPPPDEDPVK
jgi:hypothetical protein